MVKLLAAVGAFMFSSLALAQTHFECGTVACSPYGTGVITAIDNVVVDGHQFDVTFSNTLQTSPFLFSYDASAPGHTLTGVDAANALDAFYGTQSLQGGGGPGIFAQVGGVDELVTNLVTAYQPGTTPGTMNVDITQPFLGYYGGPTLVASDVGDGLPGAGEGVGVSHDASASLCRFGTCTVWTPVNAPEISPVSAASGLTLLVGSLILLRGRRQGQARLKS